jgi:hypothetical protein
MSKPFRLIVAVCLVGLAVLALVRLKTDLELVVVLTLLGLLGVGLLPGEQN